MTPEQALQNSARTIRDQRRQSLIESQQITSMRQEFSAAIVDYDANTALYRCRLEDGSVIVARSITPSGSKGTGSVVTLQKTNGGIAVIKWV